MKRETLRHPKTLDLASRLKCSRPQALGYLMLLWDFTADYAIQGDIGRLPDGAIAQACDWPGTPAEFIQSLLDSRWLDRDARHRLLIHEWQDHCERWVKAKMEKIGLTFCERTTERSTEPTKPPTELASTEPSSPRDQTNPNQTEPNQSKPARAGEPPVVLPLALAESETFRTAWDEWLSYRREGRKSCRPVTLKAQLDYLKAFSPEEAAEKLKTSIANGWTGVVFKNGDKHGTRKQLAIGPGQRHTPGDTSEHRF